MEHAARQLRAVAQQGPQHLEAFAVRHENQRLLHRLAPAGRVGEQPGDARIGLVHCLGLLAQLALLWTDHGSERGSGGERAADAIDRLSLGGPPEGGPCVRSAFVRRGRL